MLIISSTTCLTACMNITIRINIGIDFEQFCSYPRSCFILDFVSGERTDQIYRVVLKKCTKFNTPSFCNCLQ